MRRFPWKLAMAVLPAVALSLFIAGCGKEEKKNTGGTGGGTTGDTTGGTQEVKVLEPKGGTLKGTITLKGTPDLDKLNAALKKEMEKRDGAYCMMGKESETTEQAYRLGPNQSLGNVFVWVRPVKGTFFKVTEKQLEELPKEVGLHQPHCAFIPHCLFLFTMYPSDPKSKKADEKTGQYLMIYNDAEKQHNTNWSGGGNPSGNPTLGPGKTEKVDNLRPSREHMTVVCNIHGWMKGYIRVVDTPYYAISKSDTLDGKNNVAKDSPDFGTYEIKNLPAGDVNVLAWHEEAGWLNTGEGNGEKINIPEGKEVTKDFQATAK
jgi:hypothetical protein